MDQPDQNLPQGAAPQPAQESRPSAHLDEEKEPLSFFNVMPKIKNSGQIVEPKLHTVQAPAVMQAEQPASGLSFMDIFSQYKIYIISFLAIAILGPAIYFGANKFIASRNEPENFLLGSGRSPMPPSATSTPNTPSQDTISKEWMKKYFGGETCTIPGTCTPDADPDNDGLTNLEEYKAKTDPNHDDSDLDGLADGDEAHVFGTDPGDDRTGKDPKYNDADFIKGGYDVKTGQKMTDQQISDIGSNIKKFSLHAPTQTTLGDSLLKIYGYQDPAKQPATPTTTPISYTPPAQATSTVDQSISAKQDRDTRRSVTISNIGIGLVSYYQDNKSYPKTGDIKQVVAQIKPYLKVATNPDDPINTPPYVYTYTLNDKGDDYTLTFYSEVANQLIKKHSADGLKEKSAGESAIFDNQRRTDLDTLRSALLLYSNDNVAGNQDYVFPGAQKYQTALVPKYISSIPKDPKTGKDYDYQVSDTFDTFTLKGALDDPKVGTTGIICNQIDECHDY